MCSLLWTFVEEIEWSRRALAKEEVDNDFPKAVEAITDYIATLQLFNSLRQLH